MLTSLSFLNIADIAISCENLLISSIVMFVNSTVVKIKIAAKEIVGNVPLRKICIQCKILNRKLKIICVFFLNTTEVIKEFLIQ